MGDRRVETGVGAFVLFTIVFAGLLLVLNNPFSSPFGAGKKEYYILLDTAPGVGINTPVRKDGIPIGYVSAIEAGPDGIKLTIRVNADFPIYSSDECQVKPSSIFGDAVVEFTRGTAQRTQPHGGGSPNDMSSSPIPSLNLVMQPGDGSGVQVADPIVLPEKSVIRGHALPDPISALTKLQTDLGPAVQKLGEAGEKVAILADKVNTALGDDIGKQRVQAVMDKLVVALDDFSRVMQGVDEVMGNHELRENIRRAIADIPLLVAEARTTVASARDTLANVDTVVSSAERNLNNIEGLTAPLGERGEQLAELVISSIENLDILTSDISKFAYALNSSEGTIGRLVRDAELYNNVNQVAKNIDHVVRQLSGQIKIIGNRLDPIMNDIRVFTDAIARNPGSIVRGAVEPSIRK